MLFWCIGFEWFSLKNNLYNKFSWCNYRYYYHLCYLLAFSCYNLILYDCIYYHSCYIMNNSDWTGNHPWDVPTRFGRFLMTLITTIYVLTCLGLVRITLMPWLTFSSYQETLHSSKKVNTIAFASLVTFLSFTSVQTPGAL